MAARTGRGRAIHGMRHRRLSRLCGAARLGRLRPRLPRGAGLPGGLHPLGGASGHASLRVGGVTVDLSRHVGRVRLKTPVMAASGTFGYGTEVPLSDRSRLGGMVSKGIFLNARPGTPPPRIVEAPSGMLSAM